MLGTLAVVAIATHVASGPTVDGRLDDAAWAAAVPHAGFTQKFPNEGTPPTEPTTFRVVYDDDSVYVGIDCIQEQVPIVGRLTRRDHPTEADIVSVAFDSRGDGRGAYELTVNAAGVESDALRFNDTDIDTDWDETWDARVARTARGWSAELRVPLRVLRSREGAAQDWGLQVRRYVSKRQEIDEWSFIPRAAAGEVSRYGRLRGVEAHASAIDVELRPFVLGRLVRRDAGADAATRSLDLDGSFGLDAKWHAKRDLTLDLALLPDFAQVEADQLILNLTNEEIQLPEKRPFFFEGRDLFETPLDLVYTRRLGRITPEAPELGPGETLAVPLQAARLLGATKLTGRVADGLGLGVFSALTARNEAQIDTASGRRITRALEPRTLFQAARFKYELAGNAHVGSFASAVVRAEQAGEAVCGGRCTHDAYVGAVDGRWRSEDGAFTATSQVATSARVHGPERTLADGTQMASGDIGFGGTARLAKEGGGPWIGEVVYEGASRRFDYNDLGFMPRANFHEVDVTLERRTLAPWFRTLETHTRLELRGSTNTDGRVLMHRYQLNTDWKFQNFWEVFVEGHFRGRRFDDREVGDGTALERRELVGFELEMKTDPRRPVSFALETQTQHVFDGLALEGLATIFVRPIPALEVSFGPEWVRAAGEPRFVGRTEHDLVFGTLDATELSGTLRASYTFTPRLSLQTYAQLFLAAGHYTDFGTFPVARAGLGKVVHRDELTATPRPDENPDFRSAALNANVVFRWEYALGSTLFFVYTRTQSPRILLGPADRGELDTGGLGRAPASDTLLLKLTHFFG